MNGHGLALNPTSATITCACGQRFAGVGARAAAERHLAAAQRDASRANGALTRRRKARLADLRHGLATTEAARLWHINHGGAYKYLAALKAHGAVTETIERGFPPRARWRTVDTSV